MRQKGSYFSVLQDRMQDTRLSLRCSTLRFFAAVSFALLGIAFTGCAKDETPPIPKNVPSAAAGGEAARSLPPGVENKIPADARQKIMSDPNAPQAVKDRLKSGGSAAP